MIKIKIPAYMVCSSDKVNNKDSNHGLILMESGISIYEALKKATTLAPQAFGRIFKEDGQINRNCIVVYNENLINKNNITNTITKNDDEIEILVQFAGG